MGRTHPNTCAAKMTYETAADAQPHVDALNLTFPFCGAHSYECNVCGKWHVSGEPNHPTRRHKRKRKTWMARHDLGM